MVSYGTNVVAGVTPGKGGECGTGWQNPLFDSVKIAAETTGANTSVIFRPRPQCSSIRSMKLATPVFRSLSVSQRDPCPGDDARTQLLGSEEHEWLAGPNCPGLLTPSECKRRDHSRGYRYPWKMSGLSHGLDLNSYGVLYALAPHTGVWEMSTSFRLSAARTLSTALLSSAATCIIAW